MPNDALTYLSLSAELNDTLKGGKITKIANISSDTFLFTIRAGGKNHKLIVSCNPTLPRIHLSEQNYETTDALGFCMHLRKHLLNGYITRIYLYEFERIINIDIAAKDELFESASLTLSVELMGRHSNILLLQETPKKANEPNDTSKEPNGALTTKNEHFVIKHAARPTSLDNNTRVIFGGFTYTPPPAQSKVDFRDSKAFSALLKTFETKHKKDNTPLVDFLFAHIYGFSKASLLEIVSLSNGSNNATPKTSTTSKANPQANPSTKNLAKTFLEVYEATKSGANKNPHYSLTDFFIYPYKTIITPLTAAQTLSLAIEKVEHQKAQQNLFNNKAQGLKTAVSNAKKRLDKKIAGLKTKIRESEKAEIYKTKGDLITSNIYKLKKGDIKLVAIDYNQPLENCADSANAKSTGGAYGDSAYATLEIALDKMLTPPQNAQKYYKRYGKLKRGADISVKLLLEAESELEIIDSLIESFRVCKTIAELEEIKQEITLLMPSLLQSRQNSGQNKGGKASGRASSKATGKGGGAKSKGASKNAKHIPTIEKHIVDGYPIFVGKNNIQNDYILNTLAKPNNVWLHVKGIRGSHVIVQCKLQNRADINDTDNTHTSGESNAGYSAETILGLPPNVLQAAAGLAAYYSKAHNSPKVEVDYTLFKHVKKTKGTIGQATYTNQKTIVVEPKKVF
ncbi:MAG: NFACT family protein [Firmicutes bacterium]|nr:NFACT family protein [Bacillota bacterium]